jgi:RimJ/RimL family protein N-acetyltransferase
MRREEVCREFILGVAALVSFAAVNWSRRASLAVGIEDKSQLGIGLGTEAIALVLEYAFRVLKLHRLSVRVIEYNARAIRAYRKCGFVVEGTEREAALVDGIWHDDIMMGMLDSEYEEMRRAQS